MRVLNNAFCQFEEAYMRNILAATALILFIICLSGCGGGQSLEPGTAAISNVPSSQTINSSESVAEDHSHDITWKKAFLDDSFPDGYATPSTVSFCSLTESDETRVENVPIAEIKEYADSQKTLPRTRTLEQFSPEKLHSLLPVLDYALSHGYSKACIPTDEYDGSEIFRYSKYFQYMYYVNGSGVTGRAVSSFTDENGNKINYVYVSLTDPQSHKALEGYVTALEEARRIVQSIPDGYDELQKAYYLYNYVTANTEYYEDDYYETEWNLLYDALIGHLTVCNGYHEAIYVLFNLAGIDCLRIDGYYAIKNPYNDSLVSGHIWNVARINGIYYEFDSTWDTGVCPAEYEFFAVAKDEELRNYHTFADSYCPERAEDLLPDPYYPDNDDFHIWQVYEIPWILNRISENAEEVLDFLEFDDYSSWETLGGMITTDIDYDLFMEMLRAFFSEGIIEDVIGDQIIDSKGKVSYSSAGKKSAGYRLTDVSMDGDTCLFQMTRISEDYELSEMTLRAYWGKYVSGRYEYTVIDRVVDENTGEVIFG